MERKKKNHRDPRYHDKSSISFSLHRYCFRFYLLFPALHPNWEWNPRSDRPSRFVILRCRTGALVREGYTRSRSPTAASYHINVHKGQRGAVDHTDVRVVSTYFALASASVYLNGHAHRGCTRHTRFALSKRTFPVACLGWNITRVFLPRRYLERRNGCLGMRFEEACLLIAQ